VWSRSVYQWRNRRERVRALQQRPSALAGKEVLSPEDAAEFEASENDRLNGDLFDPAKGQPSAGYPGRADGGVLSHNDFFGAVVLLKLRDGCRSALAPARIRHSIWNSS